ncbi:MAG: GatB/YqeY domain-containing protein [Pseudomonadota bacterium]
MSETLAQLKDDMKAAMRAKESFRLGVIRMVLAAVKQREVDERIELDEAATLAIVEKMIKQRKDAVEQFTKGDRPDLAEKETAEIAVLEGYLPQAMSEADIQALVEQAVGDTGASSMKDMGKVMGIVKSNATGRLDMGLASKLVKARLSAG